MIKQCKGKDLHKVPKSRLSQGPYYLSKKYDGWYFQLQFYKGVVQMWTSGGKSFYAKGLADFIKTHYTEDFHIEGEYSYDCEGKLGDRGKSAVLNSNKYKDPDNQGDPGKDVFRVFDMIGTDMMFKSRIAKIVELFYGKPWFNMPEQLYVQNLDIAQEITKKWAKEGYEGGMLKTPNHIYTPGKRVNSIIKLKPRLTADLLCTDWKEGTGKYVGMIGSLKLRDFEGREVWAGSGLDDAMRAIENVDKYIGKVIEIEYERIDDTYIQPIIKAIRWDKLSTEID